MKDFKKLAKSLRLRPTVYSEAFEFFGEDLLDLIIDEFWPLCTYESITFNCNRFDSKDLRDFSLYLHNQL